MTGDCSCDLTICYTFTLLKVVLTFKSVDKNLWCDHSEQKISVWYFPVVLFVMLYKLVLTFIPTFESVDEILWCDHSNESY